MSGSAVGHSNWGRRIAILVPYLWLIAFFLTPFLIVLKISFSTSAIAQPPYTPVWDSLAAVFDHLSNLNGDNYAFLFDDALYVDSYLNSIKIAGVSTVIALLIGYPVAYGIARSSQNWRGALLTLVILPFWTSFLIRVYAWIGILKPDGLFNQFLDWSGLWNVVAAAGVFDLLVSVGLMEQVPEFPLRILYTPVAVYIGIVYSYLPFMILPLYATLEKLDESLLEAAADLGARPAIIFLRVTLPLSMPGVLAGCFLVFIPAVGEFVIPELLGGSSTQMIGRTLWSEFFQNRDWPLASAVAVLLLMVLVVPIVIFQRYAGRKDMG